MALSKEFLKDEIDRAEVAIKACQEGIELNQIVVSALKEAKKKAPESKKKCTYTA